MKFTFAALLVMFAAACGSTAVEKQLDPNQQDKGPPVNFTFTEDYPSFMDFDVGAEKSYKVIDYVKVPDDMPVLSVENLPEGATFDGETLTWAPSCDLPVEFFDRCDGNCGLHMIRFTLKSASDDTQYVKKSVPIIVLHSFKNCGKEPGSN